MGVMRIFSNRLSIINKKVEGVQDGGRSTGHEEARGGGKGTPTTKVHALLESHREHRRPDFWSSEGGGGRASARRAGETARAQVEAKGRE